MKINTLLYVCCFFLVCGCTAYRPEFVAVVQDHNVVTKETCDRMILAIQQEMNVTDSAVDKQSLEDLIERLEYMTDSSQAMHDYVMNNMDKETWSKLLKLRWKRD